MDDKKYWTEYYSTHSKPTGASTFAEFILPKLDENKRLIELGCGNGRDSIFFSNNNIKVVAVDQIDDEIDFLNENYRNDNIDFVCDDFTNLAESANDLVINNDFDYVYSRFTFHSIEEAKEDRTLKDPMFKQGEALSETENFTTHYRRYMDLDKIIEKLESRGFEIIFKIEDNDLAVYKDDNPYVIRIIAKKL